MEERSLLKRRRLTHTKIHHQLLKTGEETPTDVKCYKTCVEVHSDTAKDEIELISRRLNLILSEN